MEAHERALKFGGRAGVLSLDLVESAIARPYTGYYPSIAIKCAAFVQSLAGNHGFTDGNKRTTLYIVDLFVRRSGYLLTAASRSELNRGRYDPAQVVTWFEQHLRPVTPDEGQ